MTETTTVRLRRGTRDRLTRLVRQLDASSAEDVMVKALDLLEADLFWREWQRIHDGMPADIAHEEAQESALWESAGAKDWATDADA